MADEEFRRQGAFEAGQKILSGVVLDRIGGSEISGTASPTVLTRLKDRFTLGLDHWRVHRCLFARRLRLNFARKQVEGCDSKLGTSENDEK